MIAAAFAALLVGIHVGSRLGLRRRVTPEPPPLRLAGYTTRVQSSSLRPPSPGRASGSPLPDTG